MNKILRILILILHSFLFLITQTVCVRGLIATPISSPLFKTYLETAIPCILLTVFTFYYYSSSSKKGQKELPFFPIYLICASLNFLKIFFYAENLNIPFIIPAYDFIGLYVFITLAMNLSLSGYGLFNSNRNSNSIAYYMALSYTGCFVVAAVIPKTNDFSMLTNNIILEILLLISTLFCIFVFFSQISSTSPGSQIYRVVASMLLAVCNFVNVCFDSPLMNLIGASVYSVLLLFIIISSVQTAIRL